MTTITISMVASASLSTMLTLRDVMYTGGPSSVKVVWYPGLGSSVLISRTGGSFIARTVT